MKAKKLHGWRLSHLLGVSALAIGLLAASPASAGAARGQTCSGDLNNFPTEIGTLSGTYSGNVQISGACAVVAGPTVINGNLTLLPGSTLLAIFGLTNFQSGTPASTLTVNGNVLVQSGAALLLGCIPTSFPCFDDPFTDGNPSLSSAGTVSGNLVATQPLGVIVHNTTIGGSVTENGGGGGFTCGPPDVPAGIFGVIQSPVFSDYEDSWVGGNLNVTGLNTCWVGMARDQVKGNMLLIQDQLADPDGAEVIDNTISGNLVCQQNSMVWDSADLSDNLYPRLWEPDRVNGQRVGQCVVAPPIDSPGGVSPGSF